MSGNITSGCAQARPVSRRAGKRRALQQDHAVSKKRRSLNDPLVTQEPRRYILQRQVEGRKKVKRRAENKKHKSKHCSGCTGVRIDPQSLRRIETDNGHWASIAQTIALTANLR